jgi:hypothetical protein
MTRIKRDRAREAIAQARRGNPPVVLTHLVL